MSRSHRALLVAGAIALSSTGAAAQLAGERLDVRFGTASPPKPYSAQTGWGVEGTLPPVTRDGIGGDPFLLSVDVSEGNYRVTVTLGGARASETTVKAELRRLMLERVRVPAGGTMTRSFVVNVRTPDYPGGRVRLKAPREVVQEARAWDARLTLEFVGTPALRAIRIEPVTVPTLYILGDSTVADQSGEPYASWGQMLPRFLDDGVSVANHSESGESTFSAIAAHRFDKILSLIRPGDYFLVQFGHNDQKSRDPDADAKYERNLIDWATRVRTRGAIPVIVTPMNRNRFQNGRVPNTLGTYPDRARSAAAASGATLIDLNTDSRTLYEALGPERTMALFKREVDGSWPDGTHHSPYGAYELARIVAERLHESNLPVARHVDADVARYRAEKPGTYADFKVPPSRTVTTERPLGDDGNR